MPPGALSIWPQDSEGEAVSRDWYKDHPHAGPESDAEYLEWAQDNGLYVDAAGNVDYGPPGEDDWDSEWGDRRLY